MLATDQPSIIKMYSFSGAESVDDNITKKASLLAMLEQHQSNNYDMDRIALILGGAEKILYDYLSSNDMTLNDNQLTQIEQMITSQNPIKRTPNSMDEMNDSQSITYTFNKHETYYHLLFNNRTATKIINAVYNVWWLLFSFCLATLNAVWKYILPTSWYYIYSLTVTSLTMVHGTLLLLTMNRKVFKKSIGHFVFWFKILTSIQNGICSLLLNFCFITQIPATPITVINALLRFLCLILAITIFSAIDCFQLSRKLKIFIGLTVSISFTLGAMQATFFMEDEIISASIIHINSWLTIPIASLYASSKRVLCIFLWKQVILLLVKKDKCINIRYSPYLKWS